MTAVADDLSFAGRVVVVTGAGRGIGRAHADLFARLGAAVVVNDLGGDVDGTGSDPDVARVAAAEIAATGAAVVADTHSVADPDGAAAVVQTAFDAFGRLDVVVNNAGILVPVRPFAETSLEIFRRTLDVHYLGTLYMCHAAWPHFLAAGGGRIVNTTSAAVFGSPGFPAYGAAKAAVLGLTLNLAAEGEPNRIFVNAVAPGAFTRMTGVDESDAERVSAGREDLDGFSAFGSRYLQTERVSPVVAAMAHDAFRHTGQVLSASGGYVGRWALTETFADVLPDATARDISAMADQLVTSRDYHAYATMMDQLDRIVAMVEAARGGHPAQNASGSR